MKIGTWALVLALGSAFCLAQISDPQAGVLRQWNEAILDASQAAAAASASQEDYRIGTEDLVEVSVFEVPELSRSVRVSASGEVSLPLLGSLTVAGLTARELEKDLTARLKGTYLHDPQVSVFVREYKSDPVSVIGAVKLPGLYQIQTRRTLIELLAMAQGFSEGPIRQPGRTIIVTHTPKATRWKVSANSEARTVPGPEEVSAEPGPEEVSAEPGLEEVSAEPGLEEVSAEPGTEEVSAEPGTEEAVAQSIEIPIKELIQSGDPKWNVPIYPGDVIKVVQAGTFYVAGDVNRPGGFALQDFDDVSVIQALAMAGGPMKSSDLKHAVVIRTGEEGNRVEETIDLRRARKGEDLGIRLGENDILFVPGSITKTAALRALEASIQVGTGMLIWRRY